MSEPVIRAEHISKSYRLGEFGARSFRDEIRGWLRKKRNSSRLNAEGDEGGSFWALRDISFEIQKGDILGIIGKNGAGKSTLLKILSRITEPTEGCVSYRGRTGSLLEVGTGFHPELTGRDNIFLNGSILGMTRREISAKLDEIVAFAGVEKFLDTPVKRYSSGMIVRLGFAVAAHLEPEILIVDEVLAVGDADFQSRCVGKMGEVASHGRTVLFVSHNLGVISNLCARTMLLESGRLVADGPTRQIVDQYLGKHVTEASGVFEYEKDSSSEQEEVVFTRLSILNEGGVPMSSIVSGEKHTFEVHFKVFKPVQNMYVTVGICTPDHVTARLLASKPWYCQPGEYSLRFEESTVALSKGSYNLVLGVGAQGRVLTQNFSAGVINYLPNPDYPVFFSPGAAMNPVPYTLNAKDGNVVHREP